MTKSSLKCSTTPARHHLDRRAHSIVTEGAGNDNELLTTGQVAAWLGVSTQWLEIGRSKNYGPSFVRIGTRKIAYKRGDVLAWLQKRTYACTAHYDKR